MKKISLRDLHNKLSEVLYNSLEQVSFELKESGDIKGFTGIIKEAREFLKDNDEFGEISSKEKLSILDEDMSELMEKVRVS